MSIPKMKSGSENQIKKSAVIVGASGYAGLQLARLILRHPGARLDFVIANHVGFRLCDFLAEDAAAHVLTAEMSELSQFAKSGTTFFLCTPADVSMDLAPALLDSGADVIDLSGAFRLSPDEAKQWYQLTATAEKFLRQAQYGLVPWCGPASAACSGMGRLVSNPGCYATSVLMAILPLLKAGLIDPDTVVIDAKSGATGAGKKASGDLLYCEVEGECLPYKIGSHQHLPEICKYAAELSQTEINPFFSTHLLATRRGIISGIYAKTAKPSTSGESLSGNAAAAATGGVTTEAVREAYDRAYADYALVSYGELTRAPRSNLTLKRIVGSARTEIRYTLKGNQLYVFSWIDNLMKGAASQAVENFNRLHDFSLTTGLDQLEGVL
jgi:N-acetyl-gamma-glutamyl-phosphate reductase